MSDLEEVVVDSLVKPPKHSAVGAHGFEVGHADVSLQFPILVQNGKPTNVLKGNETYKLAHVLDHGLEGFHGDGIFPDRYNILKVLVSAAHWFILLLSEDVQVLGEDIHDLRLSDDGDELSLGINDGNPVERLLACHCFHSGEEGEPGMNGKERVPLGERVP